MKSQSDTIVDEWNLLAERFNTHKSDTEIHPDALVNIDIGWPAFLEQIEYHKKYLGKRRLNILDYGCGTGRFLLKLYEDGHHVSGVDRSDKMLEHAIKNAGKKADIITFKEYTDLVNSKKLENKYDVITSMHVFDWIEDIEGTLSNLSKAVKPNGIIIFSVFPKKHICDSLKIKDLFEDFDCEDDPREGIANFDGVRVPVYVREASFYDQYFSKIGFDKVFEFYPPYSKHFLKKSKWTASLYPEMLILAYRKL